LDMVGFGWAYFLADAGLRLRRAQMTLALACPMGVLVSGIARILARSGGRPSRSMDLAYSPQKALRATRALVDCIFGRAWAANTNVET
jgi:hypothetical protein